MHYHVVYSNDNDDEWLLNRIWNSEKKWYKTEEVTIREKEAEKWRRTVGTLNKREEI